MAYNEEIVGLFLLILYSIILINLLNYKWYTVNMTIKTQLRG